MYFFTLHVFTESRKALTVGGYAVKNLFFCCKSVHFYTREDFKCRPMTCNF